MPDLTGLTLSALGRGRIYQYPDKKLYGAALALKPEERPEVDVRMQDPKNTFIFRNPRVSGLFDKQKNYIAVNREGEDYTNKQTPYLSALLAHEGRHAKAHATGGDVYDEVEPYKATMSVLDRYNLKDPGMEKRVQELLQKRSIGLGARR